MPDGALHVSSPDSGLGALGFGNKAPSPGSAPARTRLGSGFLSHSFWEALPVPPCQIRGLWHGVGHLWHIPELDLFPRFHLRGAPWPAEPGRRLILSPNSYFEGDDVRSPAA